MIAFLVANAWTLVAIWGLLAITAGAGFALGWAMRGNHPDPFDSLELLVRVLNLEFAKHPCMDVQDFIRQLQIAFQEVRRMEGRDP